MKMGTCQKSGARIRCKEVVKTNINIMHPIVTAVKAGKPPIIEGVEQQICEMLMKANRIGKAMVKESTVILNTVGEAVIVAKD